MTRLVKRIRVWRWPLAGGLATALVTVTVLALVGRPERRTARVGVARSSHVPAASRPRRQSPEPQGGGRRPTASYRTVGTHTFRLYDRERGRELTTIVMYPGFAPRRVASLTDAAPAGGAHPLVVFGHGFAVTPLPYEPLLDRWVLAGYVVAAPIFPRSNANAPGGPDEHDLPSEPGDINYVLGALRQLSLVRGPLHGLVASNAAVAGQSDGGDAALAAAFDAADHVFPIGAAVILSGAEDPFAPRFHPQPGTPLLAVQGTADTVNRPSETMEFFSAASVPKYLLLLNGAEHQQPYTVPGPPLDAVSRTSIAFLDRYLKGRPAALRRILAARSAGPATEVQAHP